MQARFEGHSALIVHSGLQLGGAPKKSGRQVQDGTPWTLRHWLFNPQGDGRQGSRSTRSITGGGARLDISIYRMEFDAKKKQSLTWQGITTGKGITGKTLTTLTQRTMITHPALSIDATSARTRILTTLTDASLIGGTLCAQHTLRSAVGWQTDVKLQAGAHGLTVQFAALRVGTTR